MSKELPYFRFTAFQWLNDDISLEDKNVKGVFADLCAYYWFKDCSLTKAMLKRRFSDAIDEIETLVKSEIIKIKENSEFIQIKFLDEQYDLLSNQRKARQEAGRKRWKQSSSKAQAKLKQSSSYKDNNKDNNKDKDICVVIDYFNKVVGKNYTYKNKGNLESINARLKEFSLDDIKLVINHQYKQWNNDDRMKQYLTIETIFRPSNFEKYLNNAKANNRKVEVKTFNSNAHLEKITREQ